MATADKNAPLRETMSVLVGKSIIVAGAGIGGLAFSLALSEQWQTSIHGPKPKLTIFERDSYDERVGREGYTLSLRIDGGQGGGVAALDRLGLYEKVRAVSLVGEDPKAIPAAMIVWDKHWQDIIRIRTPPYGPKRLTHMRARRNALQRVLADAVVSSGDEIRWSTSIVDVERTEDQKTRITLNDGTSVVCDILVVADGSKSKIRSGLRPGCGLDFAGVISISGTAVYDREDELPKPLNRNWGIVLGGKGNGLFVSPVDSRSVLWSVSYMASEPRKQLHHPIPEGQTQELLKEAQNLGKDFPPRLHALIEKTDPTTLMVWNAMDRKPFSHSVSRDGPVIFIGDSNHAVSGFAGNGANMALMDGWDLAGCLCRASSLDVALLEYDKLFMPRTTRVLKISHININVLHSTGVKLMIYTLILRILSIFVGVSEA